MKRFAVILVLALATAGCSRKAATPAPASPDSASAVPAAQAPSSVESTAEIMAKAGASKPQGAHPVYPFSLVPGGVYSAQDLQRALNVSKDLRDHYSEIDVSRIRLVRLKENMPAYVSYRRGGHIFWTKHPLMVHAGELVLTDGHYSVRARCANQISMVPREPVEVSPEKVEKQLDAPVMEMPVDYAKLEPLDSVLFPLTPAVPSGPPAVSTPPTGIVVTSTPPPLMPPVVPIVPVCTTCGGTGTTPPPTTPPPTPPPVSVPEPESSVMALMSLALIGGMLVLRRRQRKPGRQGEL